jgi:hypothetical protein
MLPCCLEAWLCMYNIEISLIDDQLLLDARSQGGKQLMSKTGVQQQQELCYYYLVLTTDLALSSTKSTKE